MNKTKLALGLLFGLALIIVVLIPVVIVTTSGKKEQATSFSTPATSTKKPYDPSKLTDEEKSRINCFLEEQSRFEKLTEYQYLIKL